MKKRSAPLEALLSLGSLSLYFWFWRSKARRAVQSTQTADSFHARLITLAPLLLLLLPPLDIVLRIQFVTHPGFLQPEIFGTALFLDIVTALGVMHGQQRLNKLADSVSHIATPLHTDDQPTVVPIEQARPIEPIGQPMVTPATAVSSSGDNWLQGIATIQPSAVTLEPVVSQSPIAETPIVAPAQPQASPELAIPPPSPTPPATLSPAPTSTPRPETQEVIVAVPHTVPAVAQPQIVSPTSEQTTLPPTPA